MGGGRAEESARRGIPVFGLATAAAMLAGALLAFAAPELPATAWLSAALIPAVLGWFAWPRLRLPGALLAGFAWTALHGTWAMQQRLPQELQGRDLQLTGRVLGLPQAAAGQLRFDLRVDGGAGEAAALAGRRLRLGWYGAAPELEPGSRWRLSVRLKRPRGAVNPGGFDFERHALERRLAATGYVREGPDNVRLAAGQGIDALRLRVSRAIATAVDAPRARFVQALAVGDTRGLDERDWEVLRATGIAHLIAISGMHVGMVAGFGALLAAFLYRLWPALGLRLPLPQGAAAAALLAAAGYTALAGFALPTVRTLLMIGAALLAVMLRRASSAWQALALALLAVLVADPLSLLGAGFWLSFLGVAWLLWCLPREAARRPLRSLLSAQGVMTLSLLPLTVWFFGQASVIGPLANLIAVPWVSLGVVPLALAGTALALVAEPLGTPFFVAAAWLMEWLWQGLEPAARLHGALVYLPEPSLAAFVLALAGAGWLLLPRGLPGKALAALLFVPLLWPARQRPAAGEAELWLLDVGQGLSLLVLTERHALLYDAGPAFPGGLDMGEATVLPALRALGIDRLDRYVESHGDNDHAGGSAAVIRGAQPQRVLASAPARDADPCAGEPAWEWDGVRFSLLHPPPDFPYLKNDSSCVLRIDTPGADALLAGDISEAIEARLLRTHGEVLRAEVLLVPHHGSRSSSSPGFIAAVAPRVALIGVGHRNRFGLPRPDVLARYAAAGASLHATAQTGAVRLRFGPAGAGPVEHWRERQRHFWREP